MNILQVREYHKVGDRSIYVKDFPDLVPQGRDEWQTLCPVSKLTGWPMSLQQAVTMISDKNSRLAEVLMQELPTLKSDNSISDDDKLKMLANRLEVGSFAENDKLAEALGKVASEFFPQADVEKVLDETKIEFKSNETPQIDE